VHPADGARLRRRGRSRPRLRPADPSELGPLVSSARDPPDPRSGHPHGGEIDRASARAGSGTRVRPSSHADRRSPDFRTGPLAHLSPAPDARSWNPTVELHADASAAERHSLYREPQSLLLSEHPGQRNSPTCRDHAVPREPRPPLQRPHGEARSPRVPPRSRDLTVGDHLPAGDLRD
jgi:hypothetical protein